MHIIYIFFKYILHAYINDIYFKTSQFSVWKSLHVTISYLYVIILIIGLTEL